MGQTNDDKITAFTDVVKEEIKDEAQEAKFVAAVQWKDPLIPVICKTVSYALICFEQ